MILETLIVVDSRFDGYRATNEESITHFNPRHEVIVTLGMHEFSINTKVNTILFYIITTTNTQ